LREVRERRAVLHLGYHKVQMVHWGHHEIAFYYAKIIESEEPSGGDPCAGWLGMLCSFSRREGHTFDGD